MLVYKLSVVIRKKTHTKTCIENLFVIRHVEKLSTVLRNKDIQLYSKKQTQILAMKLPVVIRKNNNTKT